MSTSHEDDLVAFACNGEQVTLPARPLETVLGLLRSQGLTGTKRGCSRAQCGACTILVDGAPRYACVLLPRDVEARDVRTVEGLAGPDGRLHRLQQAFIEQRAFQCGFCTPGMLMAALVLLESREPLDEAAVRRGLAGNLCRCGSYDHIVSAVLACAPCPGDDADVPHERARNDAVDGSANRSVVR